MSIPMALSCGSWQQARHLLGVRCALSSAPCPCQMQHVHVLVCTIYSLCDVPKNGPYSGWHDLLSAATFGLASRVGEEVPEDVNQMIARCMAEDPAERPSAKELVAFFSDLATSTSGDSAAGLSPQKVRAGVVIQRKILGYPYSHSKKDLGPSQHARNGGQCNLKNR